MLGLCSDPHRRHLVLTLLVAAGLAVYLTGAIEAVYGFDLAMLLTLFGGFPIYFEAISSLARRKISANLAVSLAALAALYLAYAGDTNMYAVAAEVILIMLIGEALEHFAIDRTRTGIAALLALRPETARVMHGRHEHAVPVEQLRPDDVVLLKPGDRVPVDGRVLAGHSTIDQSPITGESLPVDKQPGDEVFAGTINLHGSLEVSVERLGKDTTLEQIIHLVEEAEAAKAPTARLADRYATYFVPVVIAIAVATYLLSGDLVRSVAVLVVACPCALVLATPTAIAAGIGSLVRRGVLVKGGAALEKLGRLRSVVFDKTGTLTMARLRITEIAATPGHDQAEVLRLAAAVERHSEHPVGRLLVEEAEQRGIEPAVLPGKGTLDFTAHPGLGAEARVDATTVRVGNLRFLQQAKVAVPEEFIGQIDRLSATGATVVLIARGQQTIGAVAVADTIRTEARETIDHLRRLGIERIAMLTGDHHPAARSVADALDITESQSGLLPADKVAAVRRLRRDAGPVAMVGDGINDAPSLVAADVGVAMAGIGTDVAIASADVVLIGDDLRKLPEAIICGREMLRIIRQNILAFALVFNALAVAAASFGWMDVAAGWFSVSSPVVAAVLHQVGSLAVVLNSLRLLVDRRRWRQRLEHWRLTWRRRRRWAIAAGVILLAAAYTLSGFHVVGLGEVAVVQRFGRIVQEAEPPGLHYRLPYPFGRHETVRPKESRRVEIGFRTVPGEFAGAAADEWNVQHRGGRHQRQAAEATVLTGDENLVDVNLVVQYRLADPKAALVGIGRWQGDGRCKWDVLVRLTAEAALRAEMSRRPVEAILASHRAEIAEAVHRDIARTLDRYGAGLSVVAVCLGDVHPPLEVVPEFRQVASAREDKEAKINEAEAYQYKTEALARGQADEKTTAAAADAHDRTAKAQGRAERFEALAKAAAAAPELTRLRLYLKSAEEFLAGRTKIILDRAPDGARRQLFFGRKDFLGVLRGSPSDPTPDDAAVEGYQEP